MKTQNNPVVDAKRNGEGAVRKVKVTDLAASPFNVRKSFKPGTSIEHLAESIFTQGLIHNLTVVERGERYEVIAGERRRRALQLLVKSKRVPKNYEVHVLVVPESEARAISLSENHLREAMHPADAAEAFFELVAAGKPLPDIAAQFGVSEGYVRQRMKLANLAPELIVELRDDRMTLAQAEALTLGKDHAQQVQVWRAACADQPWMREPSRLRERLTDAHVSQRDPRVIFVGIDTIKAEAPQAVVSDLFSDEVYVSDSDLLTEHAMRKLQLIADSIEEQWAWIEPRLSLDWQEQQDFVHLQPIAREPSVAEAAKLKQLDEEMLQLESEIEGAGDDTAEAECFWEKYEAVETNREAIIDSLNEYSDEQRAVAGVVVCLNDVGQVRVLKGLVRKEDRAAIPEAGGGRGVAKKKVKGDQAAGISDALACDLAAHHTQALRLAYLNNPAIALRAVTYQLARQTLYGGRGDHPTQTVNLDLRSNAVDRASDHAAIGPTATAIELGVKVVRKRLPARADDLWAWLLTQDDGEVLNVLAAASMPGVTALRLYGKPCLEAYSLHTALGVDMADHWTATAESYFSRVTRAKIEEAVNEGLGKATILPTKKADAAKAAERLLSDKRWLPAALRAPECKASAKSKAAAKGKPAPKPMAGKIATKARSKSTKPRGN